MSSHRLLSGKHAKDILVGLGTLSDSWARDWALTVTVVALLIVSVAVGNGVAVDAAGSGAVMFALGWVVLPLMFLRRSGAWFGPPGPG